MADKEKTPSNCSQRQVAIWWVGRCTCRLAMMLFKALITLTTNCFTALGNERHWTQRCRPDAKYRR